MKYNKNTIRRFPITKKKSKTNMNMGSHSAKYLLKNQRSMAIIDFQNIFYAINSLKGRFGWQTF